MKIQSLVENITEKDVKTKHGLSLYIETKNHKILFDLGPDNTIFENGEKLGIKLNEVDTVIISHGHYDHGGALGKFLEINSKAKIYVQKEAFDPHYSKALIVKVPIGIDDSLRDHPQVVLVEGDYKIDEELYLFTVDKREKFYSPMNDVMYDSHGKDEFSHEQNLVISENKTVILSGCGHCGVANIMDKAIKYEPSYYIGGFHLTNPTTNKTVDKELLNGIADELRRYKATEFYTCHCTGLVAFEYLKERLDNLDYLSCGEELEI